MGAQAALGLQVVRFTETLEDMFIDLAPNRLTEYIYELANLFSTFYTECKVSQLCRDINGACCPPRSSLSCWVLT